MFHVAFPRGQGPVFADLPPTLQPHAIAASAPPAEHLRTAALSGLVYLLLGGAALALASLAPAVIHVPVEPTRSERIIELSGPPLPPRIERTWTHPAGPGGSAPGAGVQAVAARAEPEEAAPGLPTEDRHARPGMAEPSRTGPGLPPGTPQEGAGSGSMVHDFSMVGLRVLHQVDPGYPEPARRARIQGLVVLLMTVDEWGQPVQVQVLEGHPAFHEAATRAARQWRFEPARLEGRPVMATFRLTLKFALR